METNKIPSNNDDADQYVARQIRSLRVGLGFTQQELAKEVGVTFQQIQKYERGLNHVTVGKLYMIARSLRVPVQSFFPQQQFGEYAPVPSKMLHIMRSISSLYRSHGVEIGVIVKAIERIAKPKSSKG